MFFNDRNGKLKEGNPHIRQSLFEEAKATNPNKKITVRDCTTNNEEDTTFGDLTNHSVWRVLGFIGCIVAVIMYLLTQKRRQIMFFVGAVIIGGFVYYYFIYDNDEGDNEKGDHGTTYTSQGLN